MTIDNLLIIWRIALIISVKFFNENTPTSVQPRMNLWALQDNQKQFWVTDAQTFLFTVFRALHPPGGGQMLINIVFELTIHTVEHRSF